MPDESATHDDDLALEPPSPSEAEPTSPPASSPPRVFLSQSALDAIREHGYTDTSHECGGVLLGEKLEGERGPVVLVEAVIAGAHTDNRRGSVTFTHETWEHINQEKDQNYSDLRIVGWYHTHPGFGIFLSDYDQFIQANFFNLPWNVAFVLDPLSGESGAFGWVDGRIERMEGYEVYDRAEPPPAAEDQDASVASPAPPAEATETEAIAERQEAPASFLYRPLPSSVVVAVIGLVLLAILVAAVVWSGMKPPAKPMPPPPQGPFAVPMPPAPPAVAPAPAPAPGARPEENRPLRLACLPPAALAPGTPHEAATAGQPGP